MADSSTAGISSRARRWRRRPGRHDGTRRRGGRRRPLHRRSHCRPTAHAHDLAYAQAQSGATAPSCDPLPHRDVRPPTSWWTCSRRSDFEYAAINPGLDVPGSSRVADQLRQEHGARAPHLPARRGGRRDGARLRQGRRQADAGRRSRDRRTAALVDGAVPGLGRSRPGRRHRRPSPQSVRRDQPAAQRAGHGPARAQLRQVRRRGDDARAVRGVGDARLQDRDDAADGAGRADGGRRAAGVDGHQRAAHSGARALHASARRSRRGPRSGAPARRAPRAR